MRPAIGPAILGVGFESSAFNSADGCAPDASAADESLTAMGMKTANARIKMIATAMYVTMSHVAVIDIPA